MVKFSGAIPAILLILFCTVSCNVAERRASLVLHDSITLQLNRPAPDFCPAMFFYEKNGKRYLFVDDRQYKEIRLFSLDSAKELAAIPVRDTGTNSIPYHFGFVVRDLDSIYLPGPGPNLFCINRDGDIIKQVDFSVLSHSYKALSVASSTSRFTKGAVVLGNDIFFIQQDCRRNYLSRKPSDYHFLFKYNVNNDSIGISPIVLPDDFWEEEKREMALFLTYNDLQKYFVFGTMYSDKIYISDDGTKITKTVRSRSKAIREYFPYSPANEADREEYFYALCKYSYNAGLLWDPANKIYYRFVWPGISDLEAGEAERIDRIFNNFPTFTIEILDQDFNTIGSIALPENRYNWNNYFLTKEGLFLAESNSAKDRDSSTWTFHLYRVRFN